MDGKSIRQKVLWERNSLFIMIKKKKRQSGTCNNCKTYIISLFTELKSRWNRQFHYYNRLTELSQQLPDQPNPKANSTKKDHLVNNWKKKKKKVLINLKVSKPKKENSLTPGQLNQYKWNTQKKFKLRKWKKKTSK